MMDRYPWPILILAAGAVSMSCDGRSAARGAEAGSRCDADAARQVAERLGERMKRVSLLAPDSVVVRDIQDAYADAVTPGLLSEWLSDPSAAPGRSVSSPWPERIEVRSVEPAGAAACRVEGELVYLTSAEATRNGDGIRREVVLRVVERGGWRVSELESRGAALTDGMSGPDGPADVIRRYYAAIAERDYERAYHVWADSGAASGQTLASFAAGFDETARVDVEVGDPGRVEGAAGSRYVEVPVVGRATTVHGEKQRFEGTYTLRRAVVDGSSEEERRWHIHSADIVRTE